MDTSSINSFMSGQNPASIEAATKADDLGKDEFLKLLAVQLEYQDPLDPLKNTDFIAQMAQFSTLEGITNMSSNMETMSSSLVNMKNLNVAGLIGKEVKLPGSGLELAEGGTARMDFVMSDRADSVSVNIYNHLGTPVRAIEAGHMGIGPASLTWDGMDNDGNQLPAGNYSYAVMGTNRDGSRVGADSYMIDTVEGVVFENDTPFLLINGQKVNYNSINEIRESSL